MYGTGMYVQYPSITPSICRQYCKHSLVDSLSHLLHLSSPVTVNKQKILEWSFKNSSAIRTCGCNYCLYGQVYSFSFLPSLCNRQCASFQAFCLITIGRRFAKFRVCLTQVPDFILRVTLKSWAGTDLHELKSLKVLDSPLLLHFPSLSISIKLRYCMFSFLFSFSDSSYAKSSVPSRSPHYIFSFAHKVSVSPHVICTAGLLPRYLCHPGQFLPFLSTPSGYLKSSSLFISPLLPSFPWFSMSPSFLLPILFYSVSPSSPSLCSAALHSTLCPFIFLGPFLVEVPLSIPISPPPPSPLLALSCVFFGVPIQQCSITTPALALMGFAPIWQRMRDPWDLSGFLGGCCCAGVLALTFHSHPDTGNWCQNQEAQGSTGSRSTGRSLFVMEEILVD